MRQGSDVGGRGDQSAGYVLSSGPASSAPKLHDTEPSLPSRARSALNGEHHLQKADAPTGAVAGRVESGSQLDPKLSKAERSSNAWIFLAKCWATIKQDKIV